MKFHIYRTSASFLNQEKPCPRAYGGERNKLGRRNWFIDIDTIDQLMELLDEIGVDLIISRTLRQDFLRQDLPEIEIYDDYRE